MTTNDSSGGSTALALRPLDEGRTAPTLRDEVVRNVVMRRLVADRVVVRDEPVMLLPVQHIHRGGDPRPRVIGSGRVVSETPKLPIQPASD